MKTFYIYLRDDFTNSFFLSAGEFGLQPEPSVVLSQLRHNGTSLPLARQPSPPLHPQATSASASPAPQLMTVVGVKTNAPNTGLDPQNGQGTPQQLQQRAQLKSQKRRIPPTSKVVVFSILVLL